MDKPSVGRIVHYTGTAGVGCRPAIIDHAYNTDSNYGTENGMVDVIVFGAPHNLACFKVPQSVDGSNAPGTWHWPERV